MKNESEAEYAIKLLQMLCEEKTLEPLGGEKTESPHALLFQQASDVAQKIRILRSRAIDSHSEKVDVAEKLKTATRELAEERKQNEQLIASLKHQLRSPVASVVAASKLLAKQLGENPPESFEGLATALAALNLSIEEISLHAADAHVAAAESSRPVELFSFVQRQLLIMGQYATSRETQFHSGIEIPAGIVVQPLVEQFTLLFSYLAKLSLDWSTGPTCLVRGGCRILSPTRVGFSLALGPVRAELDSEASSAEWQLARRKAQAMGGTLGLASIPGGSSFLELQLPLERVDVQTGSLDQAAALEGIQLLLVEDEPFQRKVHQQLAQKLGCHVTTAESTDDALQICAKNPIDVILTDLRMPKRSGIELVRALRQGKAGKKTTRLPVVGFTAGVTPQAREQALGAGMFEVVNKPWDARQLETTLAGAMLAPHASRHPKLVFLHERIPGLLFATPVLDTKVWHSYSSVACAQVELLSHIENLEIQFASDMENILSPPEGESEAVQAGQACFTLAGRAAVTGALQVQARANILEKRYLESIPWQGFLPQIMELARAIQQALSAMQTEAKEMLDAGNGP